MLLLHAEGPSTRLSNIKTMNNGSNRNHQVDKYEQKQTAKALVDAHLCVSTHHHLTEPMDN